MPRPPCRWWSCRSSLPAIDTADIRAQIDGALEIARGHLFEGVDSLCCGGAGRVDFLTEAAARLGRSELLTVAQDAATALIERVGLRGRCDSGWDEKRAWQVVLFHGAPGVGYSLLRVGHPMILPSVLLWS